MARKQVPALALAFKGRWRIVAMDLWDKDAIDLVEPGFITFNGEEGEMRFIAVRAWLDVRYRRWRSHRRVHLGGHRQGRSAFWTRLGYPSGQGRPSRPYLLPQMGTIQASPASPDDFFNSLLVLIWKRVQKTIFNIGA